MSKPILSLIVPVKDEEDAVDQFVLRVVPILEGIEDAASSSFEILFVDDGSSDRTLERLRALNVRDPRIRAVSFSRNFGKEAALSAGIDHAKGAAVIPIDVDLQDPPEVIPQMVSKWREGFDVVYGVRDNRDTDSMAKRITADLYYRTHNMMSADKIPLHAGDFRLLDRKVVDVIRQMPERNRFMKGLFSWAGFNQAAIHYTRRPRALGKSKFNYWRLWTFAIDGITSASTVPLRIWSYLGGIIALLSLGYAMAIVIRTLLSGSDVPGYASLMTAVLFLGGLQLLSLGILGEYVGRILIESKGRPLYIIDETIGGE